MGVILLIREKPVAGVNVSLAFFQINVTFIFSTHNA